MLIFVVQLTLSKALRFASQVQHWPFLASQLDKLVDVACQSVEADHQRISGAPESATALERSLSAFTTWSFKQH